MSVRYKEFPIADIKVKNRIRKDYGDIKELADDIRENGLINPPVINWEHELLAGERRIMACKSLGWTEIPVTIMETRDYEHDLNIEISENEVRKGFSKAERADYMKRLLMIEQEKAKSRQNLGETFPQGGRARDLAAKPFGISGKQLEKEVYISENRDCLIPADFADWDEGILSTNKVYKMVKNRLENSEKECFLMRTQYNNTCKKLRESEKEKEKLQAELKDPEQQTMKRLKDHAFSLCVGVRTFLERYGGKVYLLDEFDQLPDNEKKAVNDALNAMENWVCEMRGLKVVEVIGE